MNIVLTGIRCLLNALMYLILAYCFLPFKLKRKEMLILFMINLTNVMIINKVGNFAVIALLISVSIYIASIRNNKVINILSFIVAYLFIAILDPIISLFWNAYICPISSLLQNYLYYNLYMISLIIVLLLIGPIVGKYFHILISKIQKQIRRNLLSLIVSNLSLCLLIFLFNIFVGEYIGYTPCKCQYKNVGFLLNKNVVKPTFLFNTFRICLLVNILADPLIYKMVHLYL